YNGLDPADVAITTLDNDSAFIDVTPPTMTLTGEAPDAPSVTFSVVLTSAPKFSVTILLASSTPTEGVVSSPASSQLVFDKTNWNTAQIVTVTGVDDTVVDGDQPYVIHVGPSMSMDPAYDQMILSDIKLTNVDNDVAPP